MALKWGRIIMAAIVAEIVPLVLLVAIVAATVPPDVADETAYAAGIGRWVGPIGVSLMAFLGALWVGRGIKSRFALHGILIGVILAVIDLVTLVVMGAPFAWLFVVSNTAKIVCGMLGGVVAAMLFRPGTPETNEP